MCQIKRLKKNQKEGSVDLQLHFFLIVLCRRAQLRHCLEQLKKQVPLSSDSMRNTTLNLLRRAQLHIKVRDV